MKYNPAAYACRLQTLNRVLIIVFLLSFGGIICKRRSAPYQLGAGKMTALLLTDGVRIPSPKPNLGSCNNLHGWQPRTGFFLLTPAREANDKQLNLSYESLCKSATAL
jgi:hypothetical protein